jgi:hypothetical protein
MNGANSKSLENAIAYIHGRVEKEIEGFAISLGIPAQLLAQRVAELLHPSGSRDSHPMPLLRRKARQLTGSAVGEMEVVGGARDDMRTPPTAKKRRMTTKTDKRWRNKDGTLMNADERHREQMKRQAVRDAA